MGDEILNNDNQPAESASAAPKTRQRIVPFVRVALRDDEGRWSFYESIRAFAGKSAKAAAVFGPVREDVVAAVKAAVGESAVSELGGVLFFTGS